MSNQEIWDLAWDALTGMIGQAALFSLVGFISGIVLVVVCGKKRLFLRENRIWNFFAKLTYVYVPVVFLIVGGLFGVVRGGHKAANRSIDAVCMYSTKVIPSFKTYLDQNWESVVAEPMSLEETAGRFFTKFYVEPESDGYFDRKKAKIINFFTMNAGKWIVVGLATVVVVKAGDAVGLDESQTGTVLKLIKDMDLSKVDSNFFQIFADALKETIGRWFGGLYVGILIKLFVLLLLPAIEVGVYLFLKRRATRMQRAALTASSLGGVF